METGGGEVEPFGVGAAANAAARAAEASDEASKATWSVIARALGPAADEYGEHLREKVARWRADNAQRIAQKAAAKAATREGTVSPRVAYKILDEGTLNDDDVAVEYLSGMLASSRSPSGRDDRALVWSDLISRMSTIQIRAHYLLYREWSYRLPSGRVLNLGIDAGRNRAQMHVDLVEFISAILEIPESAVDDAVEEGLQAVVHSVTGLARLGLIENDYRHGGRTTEDESPFEVSLRVRPSVAGLDLFAAAAGVNVLPVVWPDANLIVETDPPLGRLRAVALPRLNDSGESPPDEGAPN